MERRLAAILAADVVGYSKLMGKDEAGTLESLRHLRREILAPLLERHQGNMVKSMGDGWLVEFPSAGTAVSCAIDVQTALAEQGKIQLRVGLHIGDVTFEDQDIFGDGVNIAARLQEVAAPGAIVISDMTRRAIDGKLAAEFADLGPQNLKNINEPVLAFGWVTQSGATALADTSSSSRGKPSLAVLPFKTLSSDPEQDFFTDGIAGDLITALARFRWLTVIARNSSFTFKGKDVRIREVAKDLGVRYIVEGSVRSSPKRVRVAVQLIDAEEDSHIWAENYDRPSGELFDLQDEIVQSITGVLVPALSHVEMERSLRSNRPTLGAWENYQRGLAFYFRPFSHEDHANARKHFDLAIQLDPSFADAHAMIALMGVYSIRSGQTSYSGTTEEITAEARNAAETAVQLEDGSALAHIALGLVNDRLGDVETAIAECQTALRLNPNLAQAYHELGFVLNHAGRLDEAIPNFGEAIRLSPNDPGRWNYYLLKGSCLFGVGEYVEAIDNLKQSSRLRSVSYWPYLFLAAIYVELDQMPEARAAVGEGLKRKSDLRLATLRTVFGNAPSRHLQRTIDNLEKAGLPN